MPISDAAGRARGRDAPRAIGIRRQPMVLIAEYQLVKEQQSISSMSHVRLPPRFSTSAQVLMYATPCAPFSAASPEDAPAGRRFSLLSRHAYRVSALFFTSTTTHFLRSCRRPCLTAFLPPQASIAKDAVDAAHHATAASLPFHDSRFHQMLEKLRRRRGRRH